MAEEFYNHNSIGKLIKNILTLRYDPNIPSTLPSISSKNFTEDKNFKNSIIENLIEENIQNSINSDEKISIALSGGIDSSLILGYLRKFSKNLKISSISIKFANSIDETVNAKNIAEHFDSEHSVIHLDNYLEELPKAIEIMKLPMWDLHWYYVSKNTNNRILAAGDGGDELFGGYTFRYQKFLSITNNSSSTDEKIKNYLACHERDWVIDQNKIFTKKISFSWDEIYDNFKFFFNNELNLLNQLFLADYNGKLSHNFSIVNFRINKYFKINTLTPLLSSKLIKYAISIPSFEKFDLENNVGKLPLRNLLKKFKIDSYLSKEKLGFSINTLNLWKNYGSDIFQQYFDKSRLIDDKLINKDWIIKNCSKNDDIRYVNKFLGLLALEIWYRIFYTNELNPNSKLT